jgi:hypothetical protein
VSGSSVASYLDLLFGGSPPILTGARRRVLTNSCISTCVSKPFSSLRGRGLSWLPANFAKGVNLQFLIGDEIWLLLLPAVPRVSQCGQYAYSLGAIAFSCIHCMH